ncbi:DUF262 domain-containing protein [Pedobacter endophyticus]|uniref:DUF262 domain-containing protein n=1 Tax=Pedobacter endophyticus TaxID=2789740 RepID=A0A7U3SPA9_9SPHI|nr:DUF262 domain-containing protein [Pedobacter endophyticus]QPH37866.1 DUF262 domain-containing protein [Pedobacter endophyticus]
MSSTIIIEESQFQIISELIGLGIPDSFVLRINKMKGSGNGEAKLFLGYEGEKLTDFFGTRGFTANCFLLKEDLIEFHNISRKEYFNPTQDYQEKERLELIWENKKDKLQALPNIIDFQIVDQTQISGTRIYVNSNDLGYSLLREIPLPIVSHINILKLLNDAENEIKYQFILRSDYENDIEIEEQVIEKDSENDPFDPELISIDTRKLTMETLLRRLRQGTINLNPDFQRNEVWTLEKKCQLIESLMLKIPLPMFYVSADDRNNYTVVDGLQRLSTMRDYLIDNKFTLQKLEFWGDQFNGKSLQDLPTHIENRILETEFTFTVINPGTPDVVKRNIFKRVNRGGAPLTDQEIRHALYSGISTEFLKQLSKNDTFKKATDGSIRDNRMLDREFILRLLAFIVRDYTSYPKNGNMDVFLSNTLQILNYLPNVDSQAATKHLKDINLTSIKPLDLSQLTSVFEKAMTRGAKIFGEHAFRKSYLGKRRTPVNKALFEVWGTILSEISDDEFRVLVSNRQRFLNEYSNTYLKNYNFDEIISRNALKQSSVIERHSKLRELVNRYTND